MRDASRPRTKNWLGTIIDRKYRLISPLGHGGMASVFLAERLHLRDSVAIKVLQTRSDEDALRRFQVEAAAAAKVKHPNVVTIYDFGLTEDGTVYIVMELLEGPGLEQEMFRMGRMPIDRVLEIIKPVASAINAAHMVGLLHRDIKPPNIILHQSRHEGEIVKVVDFGIAKFFESSELTVKTSEGIVLGTAEYMSPEQCQGLDLDTQTDVYSLAVVCYQMLTAKLPYDAATTGEYLIKHVRENPLPLRKRWEGIAPEIEAVILKALDKNPQNRPKGPMEFCYNLEQAALEVKSREKKVNSRAKTENLSLNKLSLAAQVQVKEREVGVANFNTFIGRISELSHLMRLWEATSRAEARPIFLLANAGIGKTELLTEFSKKIKQTNAFVFQARFYRTPGIRSFHVIISDLKNFFSSLKSDPEKLYQLLGNKAETIVQQLSRVWQTGKLVENFAVDQDSKAYYFSLLSQVFALMSRRMPVLLALDDLNWADETAREFFDYLAQTLINERVLIIAATRLVGEDESFRQWLKMRQREYETLVLNPFSRQQVYEILGSIFDKPLFTEAQFNTLFSDSGGNPYFLIEHLHLLISEGKIKFDGKQWLCQDFKDLMPSTLVDLIDLILESLPPQSQQTLKIAAIIGEDFEVNTLYNIAELDEEATQEILQSAIENGLVTEIIEFEQYRFSNATIRRVLYEKLNKRLRRRTHRAIAELLANSKDQVNKTLFTTAYHYYEAAEWSLAFRQAVKSAENLAADFRINDLHKYLIWAEKSLVSDEKLNKLELVLMSDKTLSFKLTDYFEDIKLLATYRWLCGVSLVNRNRGLAAETQLQQSLKLAQLCSDKNLLGEIYLVLATVRANSGIRVEAIDFYKRALDAYRQANHLLGQGQTLRQMSTLYELRGDYSLALDAARAAVDIAQASDNQKLESFALSSEAWILCKLNRFDESALVAKKALALARQSDDPATRCSCYNTIAQIYLQQGLCEEAIEPQKESLRLAKTLGNRRFESIVCDNLGELYFRAGKYLEAEKYFLKVLKLVEASGNQYFEQTTLQNLAKVYIKLEKFPQSRAYLTRAETLMSTVDLLEARCEFRATLSELLFSEGKFREAISEADQAITQARIMGSLEHEWLPWLIKARALIALERVRPANDAILKTFAIIEKVSTQISDNVVKEKYLAYPERQLAIQLYEQISSQN
ncbi:MAG: protein kinase [Acidobacteria bacterium]|nr:protein kinase [Acidobacteriota bacterium]